MRRTFRLLLEYDGTDFAGWQVQPGERTVQGVLEEAILRITGSTCRVTGAGRTDAGVHALGQVASFSVATRHGPSAIEKALNGVLPADVVVHEAVLAPDGFNARTHALERAYEYRIEFGRRALGRGLAWRLQPNLDLPAMRAGAACLLGRHDFSSFCVAARERESFEVDLRECRWSEPEGGLRLHLRADRFLRSMVRSIVGTLIDVGRGRFCPADVDGILSARNRGAAGPSAPAMGLFLVSVVYAADEAHPKGGLP